MPNIIKLDFKKTNSEIDSASYGHIDLTDNANLEKIREYILPIITKNEGWDTADVTLEKFEQDPTQFQDALDATLFANVHVALDLDGKPAGLIEFLQESIDSPISLNRMNNLKELIYKKEKWNELIKLNVIDQNTLDANFSKLESYFKERKLYSELGIVIRADLQGKKSGVSETLYGLLENGIVFAWTNNPVVVAQWRKIFNEFIYYPLLSDERNTLEYVASLAILYADLQTYKPERWEQLKFGALNSPYFVSSRSSYYLDLAKSLKDKGKITPTDLERIEYFLSKDSVQGAIFGFN